MALDSIVRKLVGVADTVFRSLEEEVQHYAWTGQDGFGAADDFEVPTAPKALVEQAIRMHQLGDGRLVKTKAKLTFLEVIPPNGAKGRDEPIDSRDKFVLADGTTGPILDIKGLRDPGKGRPFLLEVWLGVGS